MTLYYEDTHVVCDDHALLIKHYFFPIGSKRIPYKEIKKLEKVELTLMDGKWRIWGMGLAPIWFHLDAGRPRKDHGILIDFGEIMKTMITPEQVDKVYTILEQHTR